MKLKINAPLDLDFCPMELVLREFEKKQANEIVIGIERSG